MQLSREQLLQAFRSMVKIREFEERLHIENPKGEIPGFLHLYAGQEAVAAGLCEQLTERDYIISTHRGHGHCIAKGCDIPAMMLEIYGRAEGLCNGKGGSMHIADVTKGMLGANGIVGGGQPIAVGAAIACKMRGDGSVAASFTGDGAANQGTVFEAMNLAVVLQVPKVFMFEMNGYSEHTGGSYSTGAKDPVQRIRGFGIPVFEADGFDFFSVHDAARQALEISRNGGGPTAVYAQTTRYYGHFEGDPMLYRAPGEVEKLRAENDCLQNFRRRVTEAGLLGVADLDGIETEIRALVDQSVSAAKAGRGHEPADLLANVYASY